MITGNPGGSDNPMEFAKPQERGSLFLSQVDLDIYGFGDDNSLTNVVQETQGLDKEETYELSQVDLDIYGFGEITEPLILNDTTSISTSNRNGPLKPSRETAPRLKRANEAKKRQTGYLRYVAAGAILVAASPFIADAAMEDSDEPRLIPASAEELAATTQLQIPSTQPERSQATLPAATVPVITETQPLQEFKADIGDVSGVLTIPALCNEEIQIIEVAESERIEGLVGTGRATLDNIEYEDPNPNNGCDEVYNRRGNRPLPLRSERTRSALVTADNPNGNVNAYQPIAAHERSNNGSLISVFPGQPGNALIAGHGSTFSAPFAELGLLVPGDTAVFERADGRVFTFEVTDSELLDPSSLDDFLNYSHPDNASTMTLYFCTDEQGNTGSADKRLAVRFVLDRAE